MADALIVIDMQCGLLDGGQKHDLDGVVARINRLARAVRACGGRVIFVQHCGDAGDPFAPGAAGWPLLPALERQDSDIIVSKRLNDAFAGTGLHAVLHSLRPARLLIVGWATDFCVDTTVRSAVAAGHAVIPVADAHTVSDRAHLSAPEVIRHHNWVWANLIAPGSVRVLDTDGLLAGMACPSAATHPGRDANA